MTEQERIIDALGVAPSFDVRLEASRRIDFLGSSCVLGSQQPIASDGLSKVAARSLSLGVASGNKKGART